MADERLRSDVNNTHVSGGVTNDANTEIVQLRVDPTTKRLLTDPVGGYSYTRMSTATTTTIKSGAGFLHTININKAVATGTITVYDNTAGSGTIIALITFGAAILNDPPLLGLYDVAFATGLTIVTSAATDLTVSYR